MGTKLYHEIAVFSLFPLFVSSLHHFPRQAFKGRGTKRGRRCSVEVASRPGFALQLRAGASALLGEGRADRSSWDVEGGEGPGWIWGTGVCAIGGDPGSR